MITFDLITSIKNPISKHSHFLRYCGLGFQHINFEGINAAHNIPTNQKLTLHFQVALQYLMFSDNTVSLPSRPRKEDCGKIKLLTMMPNQQYLVLVVV